MSSSKLSVSKDSFVIIFKDRAYIQGSMIFKSLWVFYSISNYLGPCWSLLFCFCCETFCATKNAHLFKTSGLLCWLFSSEGPNLNSESWTHDSWSFRTFFAHACDHLSWKYALHIFFVSNVAVQYIQLISYESMNIYLMNTRKTPRGVDMIMLPMIYGMDISEVLEVLIARSPRISEVKYSSLVKNIPMGRRPKSDSNHGWNQWQILLVSQRPIRGDDFHSQIWTFETRYLCKDFFGLLVHVY